MPVGIGMIDAADYTVTSAVSGPLVQDLDVAATGAREARWIRFGIGGVVHVRYAGGREDTFPVQSGDAMPIKAAMILADTTTAQQITVGY